MKSLQEIILLLYKRENLLRHCSEKDILKIEKFYGVQLPGVYKDFLREMGRGADEFMLGSSCFFDEIFNLREGALELLAENNFIPLPENSFVFWMHQGYQFAFFELDKGDDPPVYYFLESETANYHNQFVIGSESFTAFLNMELRGCGLS